MSENGAGDPEHDYPVAGLDRRFYGFVLDRLFLWVGYAVVAVAAVHFLVQPGSVWLGIAAIAAVVVLAWLVTATTVGLAGVTAAGSILGLRVVSVSTGGPIGVPRALVRGLITGVLTLPTFGFGTAFLAVTSVADPTGRRRGWHDLRAGSVVVDVRPEPEVVTDEERAPTPVVNLTALRLVPASPNPPSHVPARRSKAPEKPLAPRLGPHAQPEPAAALTPRQGLGWPLVGTDPAAGVVVQDGAPPTLDQTGPVAARDTTEQVSAVLTPAVPQPVSVEPGQPDRPGIVEPVPSPAAAGSRDEGVAATNTPGRHPRWRVEFDTGEAFEVSGLTLVGRRPEARDGEPAKRLVTLPSDDMSLSKTHAQFQVVPDGALVVMDRGSTNGSILIRAGVTKQLTGGRPLTLRDGDRVRFGDREMVVSQHAG